MSALPYLPDPTLVLSVEVLFAVLGSKVAALTMGVLLMLPPVVPTFTVKLSVSVAFRFSAATLQLIVPVEPTGGAVHVHGPGEMLRKFVPAGTGSFNTSSLAWYGPRFCTLTVYCICCWEPLLAV